MVLGMEMLIRIYAETVGSRIDGRTLDLDSALKRVVSMLIGRLRAYGKRWRDWVQVIQKKHQDKKLISQKKMGLTSFMTRYALLDQSKI